MANLMSMFSMFAAAAPSLAVSPDNSDILKHNVSGTGYGGVRYNAAGTEQSSVATSTSWTSRGGGDGNWLDTGSASDFWISWTRNSGSSVEFTNFPAGWTQGTRIQVSTQTYFYLRYATDTERFGNYTISFHDAASGGNLIGSATFEIRARGVFY